MQKLTTIYFFVVFILMGNISHAQHGVNNNWLLWYSSAFGFPGGQTKLDFNSGAPVLSYYPVPMDFNHTHANISDSSGNMLFYTNGVYIADASNDTMQNGSGLNPGAFSTALGDGLTIPQAALIIKKPGSSSIYYIFHGSADNYPQISFSVAYYLYKTEIDMSLNGGLGGVISKNVPIISDTLNCGKITSVKHANGRDWWLMVHRVNSNKFYKFLITPTAILGPYTQNIGPVKQWDAGQAWFSPDGKKYAYYWVTRGLDIYDFNRCNATLSNPVHISIPYDNGSNVGMAISPNSNVLYVSNCLKIYQFDLTAANIATSQLTVAEYDSFLCPIPGFPSLQTVFGLASLAPDGKIYLTTGNGTLNMHTIDNPDVLGLGCNVNQHSVQLQSLYFNTLPNHPNYFLGSDTTLGYGCLTSTEDIIPQKITATTSPNPTSSITTLQFPVQQKAGVLILYDLLGNKIKQEYIAPWSQYKKIDLSPCPTAFTCAK